MPCWTGFSTFTTRSLIGVDEDDTTCKYKWWGDEGGEGERERERDRETECATECVCERERG